MQTFSAAWSRSSKKSRAKVETGVIMSLLKASLDAFLIKIILRYYIYQLFSQCLNYNCDGLIFQMQAKRKQKTVDKDFQDDIKEVKNYLNEGKTIVEKASSAQDFYEAVQIFTKAIIKTSSIQISNSYLLYYYRGLCYFNLRLFEKAEKDFMEGISLGDEKGRGLIYNCLGKCYVEMANKEPSYLEEAIKSYEKAIEFNKSPDGDGHLKLAQIYRRLKNNFQAIKYYTQALKFLKAFQQYQAFIERGLCYREIKQIQNSIDDFLKASQIKNDDPSTFFNLGINYLLNSNFEESEERFDQAIKLNPDEPQYKNYKGLVLCMNGKYESCLEVYREALKLYEDHGIKNSEVSQCWYNLANALLYLNEVDEAISALQTAYQYDTKAEQKLKICYTEGLAYEKKRSIEAIGKFQTSLEIMGGNKDNDLYSSTLYHLAINEFRQKKLAEALRDVNKIAEENCKDKCVFQLRGKIYLEDQKYQEAQRDFEKVLALDPNYPDAYYYLGMAKSNLGKIDDAIADFFKAIQFGSKNVNLMNGISYAYLKAGKAEKALVYVNIALEKCPNNEDFLIQRSMVNLELGENHKGVQDLTKALTVNGKNSLIYYRRGLCFYKNKQFEQAIEDLMKSLQFSPSEQVQPDIYYLIGVSYANRQEFAQAIEPLSKAIKLRKLPKYYHERAKCHILLDNNKEALEDLNQVIEQQPDNAFAYFRRGLTFKALKMYQESAQNFMKARQISPDDPKLILNKKQIYEIKFRKLCEPGEER